MQVDSALKQFVNNFTTAVNPQITKSYAQGDLKSMHKLVCRSAKFSAFLMMFFAVPIILETDTILSLWLKNPPAYSDIFLKWIIISSFMDTVLANSLITSMFATGEIKRYQIVVTSVGCLVFPLSWVAFQLGFEPQVGYILYFIIYSILLFVRLYLLRGMVKLPIMMYVREVLFKVIPTMIICFSIPSFFLIMMEEGLMRLVFIVLLSMIVTSVTAYHLGLNEGEKKYMRELTNKIPFINNVKNKVMEIIKGIMYRGGIKRNLTSVACAFSLRCPNRMYNLNWRATR